MEWYDISDRQERTMGTLTRFAPTDGTLEFRPNALDDRIEFDSADGAISGAILPDGTVVYA